MSAAKVNNIKLKARNNYVTVTAEKLLCTVFCQFVLLSLDELPVE